MSAGKKYLEFCAVSLSLIALTIYEHREVLPFAPGVLRTYQDQLLHTWILQWDLWALLHNPLNLFNANINYPAPFALAFSDHLLGLLPNYLIGYAISGDYIAAHNYAYLLTFPISGLSAYYYFRHAKFNTFAAAIGAIYFAFFKAYNLIEEIQLTGFGYCFLVFLFAEKYLQNGKKRNLIVMSSIYIIAVLTGVYLAYMLSISLLIYIISSYIIHRKSINYKKYIYISVSLLASIILVSPTIYPYYILARAGVIPHPGMDFLIRESHAITNPYFAVWIVFIISGGGILYHKTEKPDRPGIILFILIAFIFLILCLGPYLKIGNKITTIPLPYHIFRIIPGFTSIRFPWRFYLMAHVALSFLIAGLLNLLLKDIRVKNRLKRIPNITRVGIFIIISLIIISGIKKYKGEDDISPILCGANVPKIYILLNNMGEGAIVEFPLVPSMRSATFIYQYFSLYHHRSIFNGNSGYTPPGFGMMWKAQLPLEAWAIYFRAIGVKYIISHPPNYLFNIIEKSYNNIKYNIPPLPGIDNNRAIPISYIHPIEKAKLVNGILTQDLIELWMRLGGRIDTFGVPAQTEADSIIFDISRLKSGNKYVGAALPVYVEKKDNILNINYDNLAQFIKDTGNNVQSILLSNGIDRIEIKGFRKLLDENVENPFYGLREEAAAEIGLAKAGEEDGSIIWRIDPMDKIKYLKQPDLKCKIIYSSRSIKIIYNVSAPAGSVWKNPNLFGCNKGTVDIISEDARVIKTENIILFLPLALTEYNPFEINSNIQAELPRGNYSAKIEIADFPGSPPVISFKVE